MTLGTAGAIGGVLLMCGGIIAMAALSHCPRRVRFWPALLLATGALATSDSVLKLLEAFSPFTNIRAYLTIASIAAALATVLALSCVIRAACPVCRGRKPLSTAPKWLATHIVQREGRKHS